MYVHRRTLVAVADRFLGVGCSLITSLRNTVFSTTLWNFYVVQSLSKTAFYHFHVNFASRLYWTVFINFMETKKDSCNKCSGKFQKLILSVQPYSGTLIKWILGRGSTWRRRGTPPTWWASGTWVTAILTTSPTPGASTPTSVRQACSRDV
jgi:hypothetical protein